MDAKLMESMFRLISDAMRGLDEAQSAVKSLGDLPARPDALLAWIRQHIPTAADLAESQLFGEAAEQWFKMMGFVPRARYLEALERCEELRRRLEETESATSRLRDALGPGHAASQLLEALLDTVEKTLDAQGEWIRWLAVRDGDESTPPEKE